MTARRTCILVLGMHRSGTSALARIASLLGARLPEKLLGAGLGNEAGHWEPARLVALHDEMLEEGGSRWDDWRAFDPSVLGAERMAHYAREIGHIVGEDYGDAPLIVLKDPRIARLAPLYLDILREMAVEPLCVHINRHPLAVAASLGQRNRFTAGFTALLWLRHALDAERATRQLGRVFVSYEELVDGWRPAADRIAATLGLAWPRPLEEAAADIDAEFSADLRHHVGGDGPAPVWVQDAYGALKALEADPGDPVAIAALDRVGGEFDAMAAIFGEAFYAELEARQHIFGETIAGVQQLADVRAEEIARLVSELEVVGGRSAELEREAGRAGPLEQELAAARRAVEELHRSSSWRITAPLRALKTRVSGGK